MRNILLETFVPNLVFPTYPSLQILCKTQTGVFPNYGFLVKSLIKENCHNSKANGDIDIKLGPITNFIRETRQRQKNFDDDVMSENYDVILIFSI